MIKAYQERTSPKRHRFGEVLIKSIQNFDNISPFSSVAAIKLCSFVIKSSKTLTTLISEYISIKDSRFRQELPL